MTMGFILCDMAMFAYDKNSNKICHLLMGKNDLIVFFFKYSNLENFKYVT